jgi:hypothetical protein
MDQIHIRNAMSSITTNNGHNSDHSCNRGNSSGSIRSIFRSKLSRFKRSKFRSVISSKFECIKRSVVKCIHRIDFGSIISTATNFVFIVVVLPIVVLFWLIVVIKLKLREQELKHRNKIRD